MNYNSFTVFSRFDLLPTGTEDSLPMKGKFVHKLKTMEREGSDAKFIPGHLWNHFGYF